MFNRTSARKLAFAFFASLLAILVCALVAVAQTGGTGALTWSLAPFSYLRRGERASLPSYRRMPDRLYDDPAELAFWARRSLAAAQRAGRRSTKWQRRSSPPKR